MEQEIEFNKIDLTVKYNTEIEDGQTWLYDIEVFHKGEDITNLIGCNAMSEIEGMIEV